MNKSLNNFLSIALLLISTQALADNNDNSNNSGRISEDNISQSQATRKLIMKLAASLFPLHLLLHRYHQQLAAAAQH